MPMNLRKTELAKKYFMDSVRQPRPDDLIEGYRRTSWVIAGIDRDLYGGMDWPGKIIRELSSYLYTVQTSMDGAELRIRYQ